MWKIAMATEAILKGAILQRRVVAALMLRELHTRYGRNNIGYAWIIGEPMFLAFSIATIHHASGLHAHGDGINPAAFGALGYVAYMLIRQVINRSDGAIESNAPLLHHKQVLLFDILFARSLLELVGIFTTFIVVLAFIYLVGWAGLPARPEYIVLGFFMLFCFTFGLSLCASSLTQISHLAERFLHPFTYLLMPICGAFYSVSWISPGLRQYALMIPFVHYFEMIRFGVFEKSTDLYFSPLYGLNMGFLSIIIGICALRAVRGHIHAA